jgi:dihydroorotase
VVVTNNADVENSFSYRFIFLDMFPLFQAGALHNLEAFTSFNGPDFFGLPRNTSKIVLRERVAGKFPQLINTVQGRLCLCLLAAPLNGFHLMMSLNKRVSIIGRCT